MTSHILGEPRTELASGGLPHLGARPGESASWGTWAIICVTALIPFGQLQEATLGFSPPKVIVPAVLFALLAVRGGRITVSWLGIMAIFMAAWVAASGLANQVVQLEVPFSLMGYAALIICVRNLVLTRSHVELILGAYVFGLCIASLMALAAVFGVGDLGAVLGAPMTEEVPGLRRMLGTEDDSNAFGSFFIAGIAIGCQ